MIVLTNPIAVANEISIIHSLFAEGLLLLHIRKPDYSEAETESFLLQIGLEFKDRLVLHHHHKLAENLGIKRLHYPEKDRPQFTITDTHPKCTSVHTIKNFNGLSETYQYAFLSPVYQSLSKPHYFPTVNVFQELKKRTNYKTQLVALGGITPKNIQQTLENGFDEIALLGTIWNSSNPLENFKKCQQIVLSF